VPTIAAFVLLRRISERMAAIQMRGSDLRTSLGKITERRENLVKESGISTARCPRCKSIVAIAQGEDEVSCPKCGADLVRKNQRKPEIVLEEKKGMT
jgi:DNA-directed RNA polymerase subunit RPC12/RpoP